MATTPPVAGGGSLLRRRPARLRRTSLTGRGRTFIAVGIICLVSGLLLGVTDLIRVGVLLLALPYAARLAVRQARSGLGVQHTVTPNHIEVGARATVRLMLSNPSALRTGPIRISEALPQAAPLRFSVSGISGRQRRTVTYTLPPLHRGTHRLGPTSVTTIDPFGLATADNRSREEVVLRVRPQVEELPRLALPVAWRDGDASVSHSIGSGGSDDASVREFRHGDDLRRIHWRSTARAGTVMVRQEERPWHGESLVLLDTRTSAYPGVGADQQSPAFEWAVSATASIAAHLAERHRQVKVVAGDGTMASDERLAILDLLTDTETVMRTELTPLAAALAQSTRSATVFAILSAAGRPVMDSGFAGETTGGMRSPGSAFAVLVQPWTWTDTELDEAALTQHQRDWDSTAAALRLAGWRVVAGRSEDETAVLWQELLRGRGVAS